MSKKGPRIAAIVLTYNEETHIRECLESLTWCDELWIVDSYSTDATLHICREYTDKIVQHEFKDFAAQRNWALDNLPISSEWVFFLDADERCPRELAEEIKERISHDEGKFAGYYVSGLQYFWGKACTFGDTWPNYKISVFQKDLGRWPEGKIVHESLQLSGRVGFLRHHRIVIAKESLWEYIDRINWYSNLEAVRMYMTGQELYTTKSPSYTWKNQIKKLIFKFVPLHLKPVAKFLYSFFIQQGFRDGRRGFIIAIVESFYVFASYTKLWELQNGLVDLSKMKKRPH